MIQISQKEQNGYPQNKGWFGLYNNEEILVEICTIEMSIRNGFKKKSFLI